MLVYALQGFTLGFSAASTPGPFQAYLLGQTLKNGWRKTLPAALAPLITDAPIIALMLLVLTQAPPTALQIIQVGGGLFMLYLAYGTFRAYLAMKPEDLEAFANEESGHQSLMQAAVMNLLNPAPYIFWGSIGARILVEAWRTDPLNAAAFILLFYVMLIGGTGGLILLFGLARQAGPRVRRILTLVSAVALCGLGIYQFITGLSALL